MQTTYSSSVEFKVSRHAIEERLEPRGIEFWMLDTVLSNPSWHITGIGNERYDGIINGRRLCVVVTTHSVPLVVTAWWYEGDRD